VFGSHYPCQIAAAQKIAPNHVRSALECGGLPPLFEGGSRATAVQGASRYTPAPCRLRDATPSNPSLSPRSPARDFSRETRPIPRDVPNILFIMTDDQRKDALSVYGNPVLKTPAIDRIGIEGMRLDEFFVTNSLCAPSRATFYTGVYSHMHGVTTNGAGEPFRNQGGLREGQQTFMVSGEAIRERIRRRRDPVAEDV
jgi:hypothetical protein